jgi:hypothetical protein
MNVDVTGRDAIVATLSKSETSLGIEFAMHSFSNPVIEIDSDKARANFMIWVAVVNQDGPSVQFRTVDLDYIRTGGEWLITSINLHYGSQLTT